MLKPAGLGSGTYKTGIQVFSYIGSHSFPVKLSADDLNGLVFALVAVVNLPNGQVRPDKAGKVNCTNDPTLNITNEEDTLILTINPVTINTSSQTKASERTNKRMERSHDRSGDSLVNGLGFPLRSHYSSKSDSLAVCDPISLMDPLSFNQLSS